MILDNAPPYLLAMVRLDKSLASERYNATSTHGLPLKRTLCMTQILGRLYFHWIQTTVFHSRCNIVTPLMIEFTVIVPILLFGIAQSSKSSMCRRGPTFQIGPPIRLVMVDAAIPCCRVVVSQRLRCRLLIASEVVPA